MKTGEKLRNGAPSRNILAGVMAATIFVHCAFIAGTLAKHSWEPTVFISMDRNYFHIYEKLFHSRIVVVDSGYDAMFYYMSASDFGEWRTFDKKYFVRRIMLPAAMYAVSFGKQAMFPYAFIALSLMGTVMSAALMCVYLARHGVSGWWALGYSLFPGAVISTQFVGVDCIGMAFMLGGLLLLKDGEEESPRALAAGLGCMLCAMLTKETYAIFAVAAMLCAWRARGARVAAAYTAPLLAFGVWVIALGAMMSSRGTYGAADALDYNYSLKLFSGFFEAAEKYGLGHGAALSKALAEDFLAPALFLGFCLAVGAWALASMPRARSAFVPAAIVFAAMIPFSRYPLVNLYSCLRVQLPVVVCFLLLAASVKQPAVKKFLMIGFSCAVAAACVFLYIAPARTYFIFPGG